VLGLLGLYILLRLMMGKKRWFFLSITIAKKIKCA
jgi:hypothetical protein